MSGSPSVTDHPAVNYVARLGPLRHFELAIALQTAALSAVARLDDDLRKGMLSPEAVPPCPVSPSRVFRGAHDQVRVVREYVRAGFKGHGAVDDAVLVASELAANSVRHSASGAGGIFMVHLARLTAFEVALMVTDQGSPGKPHEKEAGPDCESGRGLIVALSLSSFLEFFEHGDMRCAIAVIPAVTLICGDRGTQAAERNRT